MARAEALESCPFSGERDLVRNGLECPDGHCCAGGGYWKRFRRWISKQRGVLIDGTFADAQAAGDCVMAVPPWVPQLRRRTALAQTKRPSTRADSNSPLTAGPSGTSVIAGRSR